MSCFYFCEKRLSLIVVVCFFFLASGCEREENVNQEKREKESSTNKLFTLTNPQETGLYFINEVNESEQFNIFTYEYLYNGGGVAVGDVNKDGLPDVFLTGNLFGGRLFLNKGNLKFEQISESAGVFQNGFSTGVTMIDINEDGYQDIYICRSVSSNPDLRANVLLINNQDLTFTDRADEYGLADKSFSNHASFFDYDNDGDLDMYLLNHRIDFKNALNIRTVTDKNGKASILKDTSFQYVSDKLYRNNGDLTFSDVTSQAGLKNSAFGLSATIADINGDGWQDIFVGNDYADKDHFYINNQNGTFTDRIDEMFLHMSRNAMGSDIADFNNDGLLDLISLDMMPEHNDRQKQLKGQSPYDMYQFMAESGLSHQVMRNTLQLNQGNGLFSEIGQLSGVSHTDWSWTPLFADFDNDGLKDLFISNGLSKDITDLDYLKFESNDLLEQNGGIEKTKILDLVALLKSNPVNNYLYKNNGDLTFENKLSDWGIDVPSQSNGAIYADLDLDGDLELIVNNFNNESFLFENHSRELNSNQNYLRVELTGEAGNIKGIGSKVTLLNEDGNIQYQEVNPYRGYMSSGETTLHFGLGTNSKIDQLIIDWPNGKQNRLNNVAINQKITISIDSAVLPILKDNLIDQKIMVKKSRLNPINYQHREDDFIDFKREPLLEHMMSRKGPFVSQGDVDGDNLADIYVGGASGEPGRIFIASSDGTFKESIAESFEVDKMYEDGESLLIDVDDDGDLDLFVTSGGYKFEANSFNYIDRLYINDGKGNFAKDDTKLPAVKSNSITTIALDFDGDGDQDIFVGGNASPDAYPHSDKSYLLINNNGVFSVSYNQLPNDGNLGVINDAVWEDINNDGAYELILAGEWMPITILSNLNGKFRIDTEKYGLGKTAGWWNSLKTVDLDGDGDLDMIAGNRGNNSFYKASNNIPAKIIAKDLDDNGSVDAIPFYHFSDGSYHPKHTLDELYTQYPTIRKQFPRYDTYSNATIKDVISDDQMNNAITWEVNTFSNCYFENIDNEKFIMHYLPNEAQFGEINDFLILKSKDAPIGIIGVGNNYGTDVEMGRSDASLGVFLKWGDQGTFDVIPSRESGFEVIGDARKIIQVTEDKIMIFINGGKPITFELVNKHF